MATPLALATSGAVISLSVTIGAMRSPALPALVTLALMPPASPETKAAL